MNETKLSPAIELASRMNENTHSISRIDAVAAGKMLRRQHEAIKQLRECLIDCLDDSRQAVYDYEVTYGEHFRPQRLAAMRKTVTDAEQALKDTEDLA